MLEQLLLFLSHLIQKGALHLQASIKWKTEGRELLSS